MSFSVSAVIRAILIWLLIIVAESAQGAIRETLAGPEVEFLMRQVAVATGSAAILAITWFSLPWMRIRTGRHALLVGFVWTVLTLVFEIGAGRLMGYGWARILADYDLRQGGLMPLGLAAMFFAPWLVLRLRRRREGGPPRGSGIT